MLLKLLLHFKSRMQWFLSFKWDFKQNLLFSRNYQDITVRTFVRCTSIQ